MIVKAQTTSVSEKVKHRLEQLDDFEEVLIYLISIYSREFFLLGFRERNDEFESKGICEED